MSVARRHGHIYKYINIYDSELCIVRLPLIIYWYSTDKGCTERIDGSRILPIQVFHNFIAL